jgi:outer membrane protein assembly factor BamB
VGLACAALLAVCAPAGATTYQGNSAHTGNVDAGFAPPLGKKWIRRDLGETLSYPVIGGGRVFVTGRPREGRETLLYALDRATGGTVWSRPIQATHGAPTYANGRVFVAGNRLQAFSAETGQSVWLLEPSAIGTPPVTDDRLVYVSDDNGVRAYEQLSGAPAGQSTRGAGGRGAIAMDDARVHAGPNCKVSMFTKALGEPAWTYPTECGTNGGPPALYAGRVWARSETSGVVIDQNLGLKADNFSASGAPAFAGDLGFFPQPTLIQARRVDTGTIAWTHDPTAPPGFGTNGIEGSLLVVGNAVYAVTTAGSLIAVNRADGSELWSRDIRGPLTYSYDMQKLGPNHGMAADANGLVVPAWSRLTALGPGGDTPGVDDPDKTPAAQTKMTASASTKSVTYPRSVTIAGEITRSGSYSSQVVDNVELQASSYPFEVWSTVARQKAVSGRYEFKVRPDRNTRYRVVDIDTIPATVSPTMSVTLFLGGSVRYGYAGARGLRVSSTVVAPPWLEVQKRRLYVYLYTSRRDRRGDRIGGLKLKAAGTDRWRARGTLRTRRLRDTDLFYACVPIRAWRDVGRLRSKDRCGARRL